MARKPATITSIERGDTVYPGRTSRKAYTVVGFEVEEAYPNVPPLVWARREGGGETWFAMRELWV